MATSKDRKAKSVLAHIRGRGFLYAYRLCRRSGLKPWCSVRMAVQYGGA